MHWKASMPLGPKPIDGCLPDVVGLEQNDKVFPRVSRWLRGTDVPGPLSTHTKRRFHHRTPRGARSLRGFNSKPPMHPQIFFY